MKHVLRFLSYALVAAIASCATLFLLPREDLGKLEELKALIDSRFIAQVDEKAMLDGAAAGMIQGLGDQWSYYIPADEYEAYREHMANAYVGIGITITVRDDGYIDIKKVEDNGPAREAGMLPGDVLTAVEGVDVAELTLDEVKTVIRGEEGTKVALTVRRGEETVSMEVERRQIQTVVASGQMLDSEVGLVTIVNFDSRCQTETLAAIESLLAQGAKALIFDVRYNPGGYKVELVNVLDYLLPEGPLFRSESTTGQYTVDSSDERCLDIPMAVLVNGDSYSAAEFFAAALSEYSAAVVVGEQTTGKGYFQNTFALSDGSAAVLSVGKYTTPNGVSLAGVGITPDIVVEVDDALYVQIYNGDVLPQDDPQIQAALEALKSE